MSRNPAETLLVKEISRSLKGIFRICNHSPNDSTNAIVELATIGVMSLINQMIFNNGAMTYERKTELANSIKKNFLEHLSQRLDESLIRIMVKHSLDSNKKDIINNE